MRTPNLSGTLSIVVENTMEKAAIIGCGNMGSAIVDAMLQQEIYTAEEFAIIEKFENSFTKDFSNRSIRVLHNVDDFEGDFTLLILAVKPQDSSKLLMNIGSKTNGETLVISLMAGISLDVLGKGFPIAQIVRCMPNTPCSIHLGMSVYCGNEKATEESFQKTQRILGTMGKALKVDNENMIDAATAISGSGPAYVFYLAEAMKEGAMELGFDENQADVLATRTLLGASTLLDQSNDTARELRRKVTSPGGTTEAALRSYEENDLKRKLIDGFKAAYARSIQLGKL